MKNQKKWGQEIVGIALDDKTLLVNGSVNGEMPDKPYYFKTHRQKIRNYAFLALKFTALIILVVVLVILCLAYFGRWWQVIA